MILRPQPADIALLARLPLLAELRPDERDLLLAEATVRTFAEDSLLFSAGDPADRYFAVAEGYVRLFALNAGGDETIIEVIAPGNSFAEAAIFATGRYPVNAEAMAGARLIALPAAALLRLIAEDSRVGLRILASLHLWQLRLMAELEQLKRRSPAQRLAWHLLTLVERAGGASTVSLPYRKAMIAARIGITPESLSRALARLARIGVESDGDRVHIHDLEDLRRFCREAS